LRILQKEDGTTSPEERGRLNPHPDADGNGTDAVDTGQVAAENDSLASKLTKELNNWRRRRISSGPSRSDGANQNHSEPARTIKVRGHETLVVRKPKLASRPGTETPSKNE